MVINFSNHPSTLWTSEQLQAISQYGAVVDLSFPNIDPKGDSEYIKNIAQEYIKEIEQLEPTHHATIHIMGEMTFCFHIIPQLQQLGYRCIASTTERIIDYTPEGTKQVKFQFSQFREYIKSSK